MLVYWLDIVGTAVFAISGVLLAGKLRMDPFGVLVLGVVTAVPSVGENGAGLDAFLEAVDQGLYQAKHQGRNRAVSAVYDAGSLSRTATDAASVG